jgi:hypothetical protein
MRAPLALASLAAASALVSAGCGGGVPPASGGGAAGIVPASVPAYLAIDTNAGSAQWRRVEALAAKFPDEPRAVDRLEGAVRNGSGLDWAHDLKPALGDELDLAWLDLSNGGRDVVGLLKPKAEAAFRRAIAAGNARDATTKLVYERVAGWTVVSDRRATIERFRQESRSAPQMLGDEPGFRHAMRTLGDGILRVYVNGPEITSELGRSLGAAQRPLLRKLGTLEWVASNLSAKPDGIHEDLVVHGTPGPAFTHLHVSGFDAQLTKTAPQDALLYLTFHGSAGMFDGLADNAVLRSPRIGPYVSLLRRLGSILQGENALYVRAPASGSLPEVTLVAAPGSGPDPATALDGVLAGIGRGLGTRIERSAIAGSEARTLDFGRFAVHYADVNGKLVVSDLPGGIAAASGASGSLAGSSDYRQTVLSAGMPARNLGFLYVNIHSTIPAVERLAHTHLPAAISRNLQPLRSALEYEVARSHELEISFFLRLK